MTAPVQMPAASAADEQIGAAVDAAIAAATAAGLRTVGAWAFTVVHGDLASGHAAASLALMTDVARSTGHLLTTYGTNDTTVFVFHPAGGRLACLALQAQALIAGRLWWRTFIRFGGDA